MSVARNESSGLLHQYLETACAGGCTWGEVDEFVRARFAPADIDRLLAQHGNVANLEALYAEMVKERNPLHFDTTRVTRIIPSVAVVEIIQSRGSIDELRLAVAAATSSSL